MSRFVNPVPQLFLDDGSYASSGRLYFYENKNYSALKATYSQQDNTVPNTNPLILDGQGRVPSCFGEGLYSVKFYASNPNNPSSDGALQWTRDDVDLSAGGDTAFSNWSPVQTYGLGAIVKDGEPYYKLYGSSASKGEQPSTAPSKWEKIIFITEHISGRSYPDNYIVYKDGYLYRSDVDGNTTTPPSASWENLTFNDSIAGDLTVGGNLIVGGGITSSHSGVSLRKTTLSITSNTTLARDTQTNISGLVGGWYFVSGIIVWNPNGGGASNGIKITMDGDASTALQKMTWIQSTTASSSPDSSTAINSAFTHTSGDANITFSGMIRLDSGGILSLWFAQNSSSATATDILYVSLTATRVGEGV